ncbi:alpha/beta hydrolase [Thalassobius sp. I31.1]|uniref:alpha/beta hydrolase n=1 Tax=Thalassobius sp. I31.1 TaxID=2109912 RepID=UPI000D1AB6F0|nr:alpha/beta hydrolase [Thalassobius sp. I31.1]
MSTPKTLNPEAARILADTPAPFSDRSSGNLPKLRDETRAYMAPIADRAIRTTGVSTERKTIGGTPCMLVHPPEKRSTWPILYGFGGGFVQGGPFEDMAIVAPLCALTGATVIIPDYRLAPEHPWPAAIDDAFAVYRAIAEAPFAIIGESAGGNLALSLMLRAQKEGLRLPSAAALLSPWCDLTNSGDSLTANDGRDPTIRRRDVEVSARHYANGKNPEDPEISPINGTFDENFPPCVITTGTRDLLLSQSVRLANVLRDNNVTVDLHVWESLWHVFEWDDRIPEARRSISSIARFLSNHMTQNEQVMR